MQAAESSRPVPASGAIVRRSSRIMLKPKRPMTTDGTPAYSALSAARSISGMAGNSAGQVSAGQAAPGYSSQTARIASQAFTRRTG